MTEPRNDAAADALPVHDVPFAFPVVAEHERFQGAKWSVWSEEVDFGGDVAVRDVLRHPGAVAVAALDDEDRLLMIRQYRHPVRTLLWEIPAGLLDYEGEEPADCARRELLEEAGVTADVLEPLLTLALSPGGTSERIRIYRAAGLHVDADARPHTGEAEERDLPQAWVPLDEAVARCLDGSIANATAVAAILALHALRADR